MSHDHGYKLLFSHPEMVRDLLTGFVHEDWVAQCDFDTLEKVGGSRVGRAPLFVPDFSTPDYAVDDEPLQSRLMMTNRMSGTKSVPDLQS